jgi:chromosome segregation ATPase
MAITFLVVLAVATWVSQIAPIGAGVAGIILALGTIWKTRGYVRGSDFQGQLDQKDAVIHTNEQTIESFRSRVEALEEDLGRVHMLADAAEHRISELTTKLSVLEQYTTPEVVTRFEDQMKDRYEALHTHLDRIESKLDG